MSDFDREAEREKLREKYEEDKEKRQASERMSELLLQGATMTNRHCKECHSPVFRYEGDEFCPTCQQVVDEDGNFVGPAADQGQAQSRDQQPAAANGQQPTAEDAGTEPVEQAEPAEPAEPAASTERTAPERHADERAMDDQSRETQQPAEPTENRPAPARDRRPARVDPPARREASADESAGREERAGGDLGEAEAALVREITSLTRQAEETRDIGRKRDLFAAAREAADTLQTVRRL
jgi:uncharacterized Zn finger protein (UPF0148 family)